MRQKTNTYFTRLILTVLFSGSVLFSAIFAITQAAEDSVNTLSEKEKERKENLEDEYDALTAKIKAYNQIIDLKQRQGATLAEQIEGLQAQADKLQLEIDTTTKKIRELENQITSLSLRITEKSALVEQQKRILSELMRVYYTDFSNENAPFLLSSAESLLYFKTENWTTDVSDKVSNLLDSVKTLRDGLAEEQALLTEKKAEVDTLYQGLAERNKSLEDAKRSKASLLSKTQAEESKYEALVDDLQKQREDIENEIEDLEAGKSTAGLPSYSKGLLAYPVKKVSISQGYGKTSFSKKAYASGKHNGIDFTGSSGTAIYAAGSGKVVGTGNLGKYAYGKWIAIDHGDGMVTLYGHLSSIGVSNGKSVKKGDKIGGMGSTGYSTGTHLHFTVFSEKSYEVVASKTVKGLKIPVGATVNPAVYLP